MSTTAPGTTAGQGSGSGTRPGKRSLVGAGGTTQAQPEEKKSRISFGAIFAFLVLAGVLVASWWSTPAKTAGGVQAGAVSTPAGNRRLAQNTQATEQAAARSSETAPAANDSGSSDSPDPVIPPYSELPGDYSVNCPPWQKWCHPPTKQPFQILWPWIEAHTQSRRPPAQVQDRQPWR